ncbi:MAG: amino acid permease [Planctomycetes bacterium]|nr:amino acid permease [Planctomycetota bacterium]
MQTNSPVGKNSVSGPSKKQGQLFTRKPLKMLLDEAKGENRLRRVLGPVQLTALGVGAVIGAGIFVSTGKAAHDIAGPALMFSYMLAGVACIFAALCYAEFASMVPVAGSAYTYAYATLGEMFAWIIGWDLVLEYAVGSATVANGWSSYLQKLLPKLGIDLPAALSKPLFMYVDKDGAGPGTDHEFAMTNGIVNLPAVLVVVAVTLVLVKGIQESARFNATMVAVKVFAVLFVILVGAFYINPENWQPMAPMGWGGISFFGHNVFGESSSGPPVGMVAGAAIIFFAYIGFDSVSTHAEEAKNPQKDVPIAIIASLLICTVLYIGVVAVLTGMVPYNQIDVGAGVSSAFSSVGLGWAETIIACAGVAGITSVLLVMMLSAPRVFLAMARDGMVPAKFFSAVHPKYRTPWKSTLLIGAFVAVLAGLLPIDALLEMANIGTLFAFVIVCAAVLIMRKKHPEAERPFRCPLVPIVPILGIIMCVGLMCSLPVANWYRLIGWLAIGFVIYFTYSMKHSVMRKAAQEDRS